MDKANTVTDRVEYYEALKKEKNSIIHENTE
jgi:hypothetical protein